MIISFIGAPQSGKTTTAANVFAELKNLELNAEFVGEKAREYIIKKKWETLCAEIKLDNWDQMNISQEQFMSELRTNFACGDEGFAVVDSSTFLSLLYTERNTQQYDLVEKLSKLSVDRIDLFCYCPLVDLENSDPNRIHTLEQSIELDKQILPLLKSLRPNADVLVLHGDRETRVNLVMDKILKHLVP